MTPQRKILLPLAIGVVMLVLTTAFFVATSIQIIRAVGEAEKIGAIIRRVNDVLSMLQDAESGQRGYLLTGKTGYLEHYHSSLSLIDQRISLLRELCAEDPGCLHGIQVLQALKDARFDEIRQTIRMKQSRRVDEALRIMQSDKSKRDTEAMRAILAELQSNVRLRRTTYSDWIAQEVVRAEYILLAVTVLVALIAFLSYRTASKTLRTDAVLKVQLEAAASHDSLTGLPNRRLFRDRLVQTIAQAQRSGRPMAVLFIDLDGFKPVNDTLGHAMGDKLLKETAGRLSQCIRSGDTVGRLGGDEFAAILSDLAKPGDTSFVAQKIIDILARSFDLDGHGTFVTGSVGITLFPDDGEEPGALIINADAAMYRAKEQGGNNYQYFTREMNERALARVQMEAAMRGALERGEFVLHYQPKLDLANGAICGIEALLRWAHPEKGLVSPAEFIPVLEETGLIIPVGEWVTREACRQIRAWRQAGVKVPTVAVNLSARQFQQKNLEAGLRQILAETGVDPALLQFEITESLLMKDPEEAAHILRGLKAAGVKLSLDDFGTGYSSLAYLKRFPLDELKIDRAFINDIVTDPDDAAITLGIISLAHSLKLKVVAEGVETEGQLNLLALHSCDEMQGYYFSRPVSAAELETMLREDRRLKRSQDRVQAKPAVLLLDDNEDDVLLFEKVLRSEEFEVLTATSVEGAFTLLATHPVGVVVSDQNMPGMSGAEFLGKLRKLYPNAIRVAITGTHDPEVVADAVDKAGVHKFLSKEWDSERLRSEVREAYQLYRAAAAA
jgi:diguanylate cyclase (GGDEF)-like protein